MDLHIKMKSNMAEEQVEQVIVHKLKSLMELNT